MSLCVKGRLVSINRPQVYQKRIRPHYFAKKRKELASRHRCISDASLRCLTQQRLRDISKRADLQISKTSSVRTIEGSSFEGISKVSLLRPLTFSQRHLWIASETVTLGLQTEGLFGYLFFYLRIYKHFTKLTWKIAQSLIRAKNLAGSFTLEENLFLYQIVHLHYP